MEIKRNFVKGVMNKSLDDRLLPDGFYRDALNIKVSSTDGNDAGTVQNYLGSLNAEHGTKAHDLHQEEFARFSGPA